jgi:hypothetical protein
VDVEQLHVVVAVEEREVAAGHGQVRGPPAALAQRAQARRHHQQVADAAHGARHQGRSGLRLPGAPHRGPRQRVAGRVDPAQEGAFQGAPSQRRGRDGREAGPVRRVDELVGAGGLSRQQPQASAVGAAEQLGRARRPSIECRNGAGRRTASA